MRPNTKPTDSRVPLSPLQTQKLLELMKLGIAPVRAGDRSLGVLMQLGLAVGCRADGTRVVALRPRFARLTDRGYMLAKKMAPPERGQV